MARWGVAQLGWLDVAVGGDVEHQQVDEELVVVQLQAPLAANECEPGAHFEEEPLELGDERPLQVALGERGGEGEKLEVVWVLGQLLHQLGLAGRHGVSEVRWGSSSSAVQLRHDLAFSRALTLVDQHGRDQPCSTAGQAYHSRSARPASLSRRSRMWPHGNRPTTRGTTSASGPVRLTG